MQDTLSKEGIRWKFQTPYASSHSGVWERQIRSMRRVLSGLSKEQVLTDEGLLTLTALAVNILNSRPLTAISPDPDDLDALTPNHLLIMEPGESFPGLHTQSEQCLRKKWRQIEYLTNVFWRRWVKEYLPSLQKRTKWILASRNLNVNDLVLIADSSLPRSRWHMGRVKEPLKGHDGLVRSVRLRTAKGDVVRPINKICLLEASSDQRPAIKEEQELT